MQSRAAAAIVPSMFCHRSEFTMGGRFRAPNMTAPCGCQPPRSSGIHAPWRGDAMPQAPVEHYTDDYFDKWAYADRPLGKFSMYWFARRYFAALIRRYAPAGDTTRKLFEMGCGLGDLLGLLQDDFTCIGVDLIPRAIEKTREKAPRAEAYLGDATDFSRFTDGELSVVVALHVVEHLPAPQHTIRDIYGKLQPG